VYVDQSAAELRLNVVGGPLDLSAFTVVRTGSLAGPVLRVRAAIVGASHVLAVQREDGPALHEVFACRDPGPAPPSCEPLYSGGARDLACESAGGLAYRFRPRIADARSGAAALARLEVRVREARRHCGQLGLAFTFPAAPRAGPAARPRTLVLAVAEPGGSGLRVETAHCYPNEGTIVFSETLVEPSR